MMAAIRAAQLNQQVTLFEKNLSAGKKLLLSGKGRCNLTNACTLDLFLKRFSRNGDFLRDAFAKFFNQDLMEFFAQRGLELKVERQMRVFPATGSSASILGILEKELAKNKVRAVYKTAVKDILVRDGAVAGVLLESGDFQEFERVIMATGGVSYSFTGSSGEGLKAAAGKGHTIVRLRPGLVSLKVKEKYPAKLAGLTLKNIRIKFCSGKKEFSSEVGELLFTHTGISGPLVFTLSGMVIDLLDDGKNVQLDIDLKPGLTAEQLDVRMLRDFKESPRRNMRNIMKGLLPVKLVDLICGFAGISPDLKANQVTSLQRKGIVRILKGWRMEISGSGGIEDAMITRGGVSLKEINPRTMESRLVKGLYFCGEMIDVDADTGGFNLQAAFSTGYLAGESAA
jgi:predicted Rossmann fold flavoprotein